MEIGQLDGEPILAVLSHRIYDEPELFWVEEIVVKNSPMTTYGISKHRISSGLLTAKPEEYQGQYPLCIDDELRKQHMEK